MVENVIFGETQAYNAPEIVFGTMWNERVDIWAAGLCVYYMLHRNLPLDVSDKGIKKIDFASRVPPRQPEAQIFVKNAIFRDFEFFENSSTN